MDFLASLLYRGITIGEGIRAFFGDRFMRRNSCKFVRKISRILCVVSLFKQGNGCVEGPLYHDGLGKSCARTVPSLEGRAVWTRDYPPLAISRVQGPL